MRPLTDEETEIVFKKLAKYIGENVRLLIERGDSNYCFRLHKVSFSCMWFQLEKE